jgi:outer membrane protein OmpA-like peptidoglycan-associated protein
VRPRIAILLACVAIHASSCDRGSDDVPASAPAAAAPDVPAPSDVPATPEAPPPSDAAPPAPAAEAPEPAADTDAPMFALADRAQRGLGEAARGATRLAGEIDDVASDLGKAVTALEVPEPAPDPEPAPSKARPDPTGSKPKSDPAAPKTKQDPVTPKVDPDPPKVDPDPPKVVPKGSGRKLARVSGPLMKLSQEVEFEYGGTKLSSTSALLVEDIALEMLRHSGKSFCVHVHTDAAGADAYNLKLSDKRAKAVRRRLVEHTVPESRVDAKGCGELYPRASNDTPEGRDSNRRTVIAIGECSCKADLP